MKYSIYFAAITILSLFACNDIAVQEPETIKIEHANLDSLSNMADSAVNEIQHTITDLDQNVKVKDKKIKRQIRELKAMQDNALYLN